VAQLRSPLTVLVSLAAAEENPRCVYERPQRILTVDDYEDQRDILRYQLRKIGSFDILEAAYGQHALAIVSRESLDLIIMNLGLPVVDGWEATRRVRAMLSPTRQVPILAFSAYAMPGDEQKALTAGCDDYLAKPVIDVALLQQKVMRRLARGRMP
jgi:two-component system cell cycle response regulator DivK